MIFFGDPETKGTQEDAVRCVYMALAMRQRMQELQPKWETLGMVKPLRIRIGINSGYCTVGSFGTEQRLEYTIIGGQVNLASRLETAAQPDQILISHQTYALVQDHVYCEKKEEIRVKGIAYPIQTYQAVERYDALTQAPPQLQRQLNGFTLSADLQKIPASHKAKVLDSLQAALQQLRERV